MTRGARARQDQYARRINDAVELLASGLSLPEVVRQLAERQEISERQARRYAERARDLGKVEVPGPKQVFTVKLPRDLVIHLKTYARVSQRTLSSLVTQALEEFLGRRETGPDGGQTTG